MDCKVKISLDMNELTFMDWNNNSDVVEFEMSVEYAKKIKTFFDKLFPDKEKLQESFTPNPHYAPMWIDNSPKKYYNPYQRPTITCSTYKNYVDTQY